MVATLAQAVRILSDGDYTIGPEGTISTEDAAILEEMIADEIARKDPGFSPAELVRFKAYYILDILTNSDGIGNITEKKVKDVSWKVSSRTAKGSTSLWMDFAEKMVSGFSNGKMPSGVARCDAYVHGLDSTTIDQYGEPALSEQPYE